MSGQLRVIDADGHVMEDHQEVFDYIAPYKGMRYHATFPLFPFADGWLRGISRAGKRIDPTAEDWLAFQDECGIDASVLYPTGGLALGLLLDKNLAVHVARAYNDWLHDRFTRVSPRLMGVALLPCQDVEEAVKELRRCVTELGFVGAVLTAVTNGVPLYGSAQYHPLWEEAQRLGCPVSIHGGTSANLALDRVDTFLEAHCLEHPYAVITQFTNMMFQGVFELFPRLKVAYLEAGVGWVPWLMDRFDEEFERRGARMAPLLKKEPSEYIKEGRIFFTAEVEEKTLPYVAQLLGEDAILWASDYPHERERHEFMSDLPELRSRTDISEELKAKMLLRNPERFYRFAEVSASVS